MRRRNFLAACSVTSLAGLLWNPGLVFGQDRGSKVVDELRGMLIADPHAHPEGIFGPRNNDPSAPSIAMLKSAGVALCVFSAVGDSTFRGRSGTPFVDTRFQLERARRLLGKSELLLSLEDLKKLRPEAERPFCLLGIEGGDALEGKIEHLETFFREGVRVMTVIHDRDNEIGYNQRSNSDGPLTPFGVQVIERMNALGMVVDVAHAKTATLRNISEVSSAPVLDSHTGPYLPDEEGRGPRRLRRWEEMEWVARTGGVVCTWPLAFSARQSERTTLQHWAEEVVRMKARLGIEHCGLGTDGGGGLSPMIRGWDSIVSLPALVLALREAGLTREDVGAFVGGNFLRVLGKCLVA